MAHMAVPVMHGFIDDGGSCHYHSIPFVVRSLSSQEAPIGIVEPDVNGMQRDLRWWNGRLYRPVGGQRQEAVSSLFPRDGTAPTRIEAPVPAWVRATADWRAAEALQTAATKERLVAIDGHLHEASIPPLLETWMNKDGLLVSRYPAASRPPERFGNCYRITDLEMVHADAATIGRTVSTFYAGLTHLPRVLIPEAGAHDPFAFSVLCTGENVLHGWRRSRPSSLDEDTILRIMALADLIEVARKEPIDSLFWNAIERAWLTPLANEAGDPDWYEGWHWHNGVLAALFRARTLRETGMELAQLDLR